MYPLGVLSASILVLFILLLVFVWLCLLFISNISSVIGGAPYVPMKKRLVKELLTFGGLSSQDIFYDLGCGNGQVLIAAVRDFGVRQARGYEASLWPLLLCRSAIRRAKLSNVIVTRGNLLDADMHDATFVYAYLFPKLVEKLAGKLERELPSGAHLLLPSFPMDLSRHPLFSLKKEAKIGTITAYLYVRN